MRAAATAWLPPLPPATCENSCPLMVSPGRGKCGERATRSVLILPTTRTRPCFTSFDTFSLLPIIRRMTGSCGATPASIGIQHDRHDNDGPCNNAFGGFGSANLRESCGQHRDDQ